MKKNYKLKSIIAIMLCALLMSCSEEPLEQNNNFSQKKLENSIFEVEKGKLHFQDKTSLKIFLENDNDFVKQAISQVNVSDFKTNH